jgi:phage tail-like protein
MTFGPVIPSDPLSGFRFAVSFADTSGPAGTIASGGVSGTVAGFSEISGLDSTLEMFDYKEGGRNDYVHKFPTRASFGNLSLKRGVATTPDLWQWYDSVRSGSYGARRSITIAHLDESGNAALIWHITRALPTKYTGPSWNAAQSTVAIEALDVVYEAIELVQGSDLGT